MEPVTLVWLASAAIWGYMAGRYDPVGLWRLYRAVRSAKAH